MIQQQLAEVTMAEIEKRNMKADSASLALEQKREDLAALLKQLMMQREEREGALKQRMVGICLFYLTIKKACVCFVSNQGPNGFNSSPKDRIVSGWH